MKRFHIFTVVRMLLAFVLSVGTLTPQSLWACACGCGVFDVGTSTMFPTHEGTMVFLEYDYQNQNRNWSGTSPSSADNNSDKEIRTNFFTLGYQHLFNRKWGVMAEFPYWNRYFKTTDDNGDIVEFNHSAVGDIRLQALYTGFADNLATGVSFGLKLPTGDYTNPNFDRDTEIGTGSTDLLLGGYHVDSLTADYHWNWFTNAEFDQPMLIAGGYRPGSQVDAALGAYFNHGFIGSYKVAPLVEARESYRWRDSGTLGHAPDSGYERALVGPGLEVDKLNWRVYADVGFPVYQNVNGNQLVASELYKLNVSYMF